MAQPQKTASEIITAFELQVNDVTELSSSEELALLNRIYQRVCAQQPWEFLKKQASGTILTDAIGSYIAIPSDFAFFAPNHQYTENFTSLDGGMVPSVIFTGSNYTPWQIVNFSDRRQYRNRSGYAYLDLANGKIYFCLAPTDTTYEFDYIKVPPLLALSDYPLFPGQFHDMLTFGMASDNDILQLSPKATSYKLENETKYQQYFLDMQYYNAQLQMN